MARKKARFATAAIMLLLAVVIWFVARASDTAWMVFLWVFGVYGFISFGGDFLRWLMNAEGSRR